MKTIKSILLWLPCIAGLALAILTPQWLKNRFAYWRSAPSRRAILRAHSNKGSINSHHLHELYASILRLNGHIQPKYVPPTPNPIKMKTIKSASFAALACAGIICLGLWVTGCGSTPVQVATGVETVTVPTVDAAMGTWAKWCYATNATASQINDVSNAYFVYVNAQTVASNVLSYAAANPSSVNVTNVLNAATASQGALLNIITLYTSGK